MTDRITDVQVAHWNLDEDGTLHVALVCRLAPDLSQLKMSFSVDKPDPDDGKVSLDP